MSARKYKQCRITILRKIKLMFSQAINFLEITYLLHNRSTSAIPSCFLTTLIQLVKEAFVELMLLLVMLPQLLVHDKNVKALFSSTNVYTESGLYV